MSPFLIIALTAATGPVPATAPTTWVDYPPAALRNGEQGVVGYEVKVDATGKPTECRVSASSGFASLDGETCRQILNRSRFHPAKNETGGAEPGIYIGRVKWSFAKPVADTALLRPPADEVGIAIQEAVRAALNASFTPCFSASQKERRDATGERFGEIQRLAEARVGKERIGFLVGQVAIDVRSVGIPACSDADEVERQIAHFEAAVERLNDALAEGQQPQVP